MVHISSKTVQRRIASELLKCGFEKVWIDPTAAEKVSAAITRADVRRLIDKGIIRKRRDKFKPITREKPRQRIGSRKGSKKARRGKKDAWFRIIRPQRQMIAQLRSENKLAPHAYRELYLKIKGNTFRSRAHLNSYLEEKGLVKKVK